MKILKIIVLLFVCLALNISVYSQDANTTPERTPEQEAAKQTEKLQQELNLSAEQARQVHEINLRYARARKVSNTRADALQRIKDKEAELKKILNPAQYTQLLNKRFERSSFQTPSGTRNLPVNTLRPATDSRTQQINREQNTAPRTPGSGSEVRRAQLPVSRDGYNRPNTNPRTATQATQQSTPPSRGTQPAVSTPRSSGSTGQGGSSSGNSSGSTSPTRNQGSSEGSGSRSTSGSSTTNRR